MSKFQVLDNRRYPLCPKGKEETITYPFFRWEHRITIGWKNRTFFLFIDTLESNLYIEEYKDGDLLIVEEDDLFLSLLNFADENGSTSFFPPLLKPQIERL